MASTHFSYEDAGISVIMGVCRVGKNRRKSRKKSRPLAPSTPNVGVFSEAWSLTIVWEGLCRFGSTMEGTHKP